VICEYSKRAAAAAVFVVGVGFGSVQAATIEFEGVFEYVEPHSTPFGQPIADRSGQTLFEGDEGVVRITIEDSDPGVSVAPSGGVSASRTTLSRIARSWNANVEISVNDGTPFLTEGVLKSTYHDYIFNGNLRYEIYNLLTFDGPNGLEVSFFD